MDTPEMMPRIPLVIRTLHMVSAVYTEKCTKSPPISSKLSILFQLQREEVYITTPEMRTPLLIRITCIVPAITLHIFENKPPPQSGPRLLLIIKGGGYFWEDTVCVGTIIAERYTEVTLK